MTVDYNPEALKENIRECFRIGDETYGDVADSLALSTRTLQRLVATYGIDYMGIKRSELAKSTKGKAIPTSSYTGTRIPYPDVQSGGVPSVLHGSKKGVKPPSGKRDASGSADTGGVAAVAPIAGGTDRAPDKQRGTLPKGRYVFTSAQNNTFINEGFFEALLNYCEHNNARLVVGTYSYNKSGWLKSKEDTELWYDPRIEEYTLNESTVLEGMGIVWCGELDIIPTSGNPLSQLESYTQAMSGIVPHAKTQMQSVPVFKGSDPKFMYTTGTLTQRNYIARKAGQLASFHHVLGALVVEISDKGNVFARQLVANEDGRFFDLNKRYDEYGVYDQSILAINYGDIHAEKSDPIVARASWERDVGSMLDILQPKYQFAHDVSDFMPRNHHNRKDVHFLAQMRQDGTESVEQGLQDAADILDSMHRDWCTTVVVHSNHDAALLLWMKDVDVAKDVVNVKFWHKLNYYYHQRLDNGERNIDPFMYHLKSKGCTAQFLKPDESFKRAGIEFGMHGHMGVNGARGSSMSFKKMNTKVNVGHTHSPNIINGVYTSGVSGLMEMGYNKGVTTWAQAHILTYQNGKRAIVVLKNGEWRA